MPGLFPLPSTSLTHCDPINCSNFTKYHLSTILLGYFLILFFPLPPLSVQLSPLSVLHDCLPHSVQLSHLSVLHVCAPHSVQLSPLSVLHDCLPHSVQLSHLSVLHVCAPHSVQLSPLSVLHGCLPLLCLACRVIWFLSTYESFALLLSGTREGSFTPRWESLVRLPYRNATEINFFDFGEDVSFHNFH